MTTTVTIPCRASATATDPHGHDGPGGPPAPAFGHPTFVCRLGFTHKGQQFVPGTRIRQAWQGRQGGWMVQPCDEAQRWGVFFTRREFVDRVSRGFLAREAAVNSARR